MNLRLRHAVSEIRQNFSSLNWWRNRVLVPFIFGTATRLHPGYPGYDEAVRVMEEDWDTMIVLDACRADYFERVADLERLDEYESRISLGSHSSEWTRRNFAGQEFGDTVYISANPHTSLVAGDAFHHIDELWTRVFDEEHGVVLPDAVCEAAIEANDTFPNKRLIIHFMQPHGPFVGSSLSPPYETEADYWQAYQENLEYVIQFVWTLVDNIPGKTVITADHGQIYASGMHDKLGLGGHKPRLRLPGLVEIPWAVLDDPRRDIQSGRVSKATGEEVNDRLKQLGYL